MVKWFIGNKNVTLKEYKNYLKGDSNIIDIVEKEEIKIKSESEMLFDELTKKVGFSHKRAKKVISTYNSKEELLSNLNDLPFEKIENETLNKYFSKKTKSKKLKIKKEIKGNSSFEEPRGK